MATLVELFDYARTQITELSRADEKTIADASGSALIPALYARAGVASSQLRDNLPLLASELGLLEVAVINLESYEGSEVMLCTGYELLDNFTHRRRSSYPLRLVHGILSFVYETRGTPDGTAKPPAPDGGGPEFVS
ncbi:hypothetical protein ACFY2M_15430 [Streptomyces sp. NPDC001276]|uniref:hypothetical protein n=1 Tax=Streptomyces sp. NPDC001276 TaxID=3364555 RepID=UPI0036A9366F